MSEESYTSDFIRLKDYAHLMMSKAYAPYSKFPVGAALLTDCQQIFGGCNVENAAYPQGMCAEAGAISAMIAGGGRILKTICVISQSMKIISPCGGCRQKIREFSNQETKIYLLNIKDEVKVFSVEELLPFSFSEFDSLKKE